MATTSRIGNSSPGGVVVVRRRAADAALAVDARPVGCRGDAAGLCRRPALGGPPAANRIGDLHGSAGGVARRAMVPSDALRPYPWGRLAALAPVARATIFACLLGMASKEVMVSVPLILLLYDRTFLAGSFREACGRRREGRTCLAATWVLLGWLVLVAENRGGTAGVGVEMSCWAYRHAVWRDCPLLDVLFLAAPAGNGLRHGHGEARGSLCRTRPRWPCWGWQRWRRFVLAQARYRGRLVLCRLAAHLQHHPRGHPDHGRTSHVSAAGGGHYLGGVRRVCRGSAIRPLGISSPRCAGIFGGCAVVAAGLALAIVTFYRNMDYQSQASVWRHVRDHVPQPPRLEQSWLGVGRGRPNRRGHRRLSPGSRVGPESRRRASKHRPGL